MTLPSLPTDSVYKFLFVAGIALYIYSELTVITQQEKVSEYYFSLKKSLNDYAEAMSHRTQLQQNILTETKNLRESAEAYYKKKNAGIEDKMLSQDITVIKTKLNYLEQEYLSSETEMKKKDSEFDLILEQDRKQISKFGTDIEDKKQYQVFALILVVVGMIGWAYKESLQDKILIRQYEDANKDDWECQSCGMKLRFDKKSTGLEYCSHCHDGTNFVNPSMTLPEMKLVIRKRMKKQGLNWLVISQHLSKLRGLDRWSKLFRW